MSRKNCGIRRFRLGALLTASVSLRARIGTALVAISLLSAATSAAGAGIVFTVYPSQQQDGLTDWTNIMSAFAAAKAAGPNNVVQFAAGDYFVDRPIQVANFTGVVRGAGRDLTRLRTAPSVLFKKASYPLEAVPRLMVLYLDHTWPSTAVADIVVSDLGFSVEGPSEGWGSHNPANQFNNMNVLEVRGIVVGNAAPDYESFAMTRLNVALQRLKAVGRKGPEYLVFGSSILNNFQVWGESVGREDPGTGVLLFRWAKPITGKYVLEDIEMIDSTYSLAVTDTRSSSIAMRGIIAKNTFDAVELVNIGGSSVEVSDVTTENSGGIFLLQGREAVFGNDIGEIVPETLPELSSFFFHNIRCQLAVRRNSACLDLEDLPLLIGKKTANVTATSNVFDASARPRVPAIYAGPLRDAKLTANRFIGSSVLRGMALWLDLTVGNSVHGNSFEGLFPGTAAIVITGNGNALSGNDYSRSGAQGWSLDAGAIYLDAGTYDNRVLEMRFPSGTTMCDQVLDAGVNSTLPTSVCARRPAHPAFVGAELKKHGQLIPARTTAGARRLNRLID